MAKVDPLLKVAKIFRDKDVKELIRDIDRLKARVNEYAKLDNERLVGLFLPFGKAPREDGAYECRAGADLGHAHGAAGMLADLLKTPVSFVHNEAVRTAYPRLRAKS